MAKAVAKSKKVTAKSKPSKQGKAKAAGLAPPRKALKTAAPKPVAKAPAKSAPKSAPKSAAKAPVKTAPKKQAKANVKASVKAAAKPAAKTAKAPAAKSAASAIKPNKWVYTFGDGKAEGRAGLRDLLGGKGANLAEMANL